MTPAQKKLRELRERQSRERQRMAELGMVDELTPELRAELDEIERGTPDLERQIRGATVGVEQEDTEQRTQQTAADPDPEMRERIELRSTAQLTNYLLAAARGRLVGGAEAELAAAAGVQGIPLELWDVPVERRDVTGAPGTVGVNLDPIRPAVFINGDGQAPNLKGMFNVLTAPSAPAAGVAIFDTFVSAFADGVDGLWSSTVKDVAIVAGVEAWRLSAKTFLDATGQDLGDKAFSDYAMEHYGGWWTNKRMPVKAAHVQQAILYRKGRSMQGGSGAMRTAVCPHWNQVSIDDIYSGSAKGERYFTMHVLLGDVILGQPDAYAQVSFRVST